MKIWLEVQPPQQKGGGAHYGLFFLHQKGHCGKEEAKIHFLYGYGQAWQSVNHIAGLFDQQYLLN